MTMACEIVVKLLFISFKQIDKDGSNPERVMQELSSIGLMPEDWGGSTPMVPVCISYLLLSFRTLFMFL